MSRLSNIHFYSLEDSDYDDAMNVDDSGPVIQDDLFDAEKYVSTKENKVAAGTTASRELIDLSGGRYTN